MAERTIMVGPWGGSGGHQWFTDNRATRLLKIRIQHGDAIDAITYQYELNGAAQWSPTRGGEGGNLSEITLDQGEFLTAVTGYYSDYYGPVVVGSLTFTSNVSKYGPYGIEDGTLFTLPISGGMITGFHGRAGALVDAIGVCLRSDN